MSPLDEYRAREASWSAKQKSTQQTFITLGNLRLLTFAAAAVLAWLVYGKEMVPASVLFVPAVLFIVLIVYHQQILRRRTFAERAIRFYRQALHRLDDKWSGEGSQGEAFRDLNHIYADDLDVFGRGSVFQLLSNARTAAGERTLAHWLMAPASPADVIARQQAVRELAPKLDLREEMGLLGEDINSSIRAESLTAWGTAAPVAFPAYLRIGAFIISLAAIGALLMKFLAGWPVTPLLAIVVVNGLLIFRFRHQTEQVHAGLELAAHNLGLLSLLVKRLESETFTSAGLQHVQSALLTSGAPASTRIRQLNRWLDLLDSSDHVLLRALMPLTLYQQQVVMAIEAWRTENGAYIGKMGAGASGF